MRQCSMKFKFAFFTRLCCVFFPRLCCVFSRGSVAFFPEALLRFSRGSVAFLSEALLRFSRGSVAFFPEALAFLSEALLRFFPFQTVTDIFHFRALACITFLSIFFKSLKFGRMKWCLSKPTFTLRYFFQRVLSGKV